MKLLLDESVPKRLIRSFPEHIQASTVQQNGWSSTKNGALLKLAAENGFDAMLTADKGFEFQHNLDTLPIAVLVVRGYRTRLNDLLPAVPRIVSILEDGVQNQVYRVDA